MKLELKKVADPFEMKLYRGDGIECSIDASSSIGGAEKGFRPMELLAGSLASCAAIDILTILRKQKYNVDNFQVSIEANRVDEVPSPFSDITLIFKIDVAIDKDRFGKNIELILDKYCSVSACLKSDLKIDYKIENYE